jgi:hypothetical protein
MAIANNDDYVGSAKQVIEWMRSVTRTTVIGGWFTLFELAGQPGPGTLAAGNTASGVVHDDAIAGYPQINSFAGGAVGYLTRFAGQCSLAGKVALYDRLFVCGAYPGIQSRLALSSPPTGWQSRVPGSDYKGLEIWIECVTALAATATITVEYLDQDGNAGTTGAVSVGGALTLGRMIQLPLQAGDSGVSGLVAITSSGAASGTFNVMIMRPLISCFRFPFANGGDTWDYLKTGLPVVYDNSALYPIVAMDGTSSGIPELSIEIGSK